MIAFDAGFKPTGVASLDDALGTRAGARPGQQGASPMLGKLDAGSGAIMLGR